MTKYLLVLIFLGCLGIGISAQTVASETNDEMQSGACPNVNESLELVKFRQMFEFVSCKPDRVYARDVSGGKLVKSLETDPNWKESKPNRFLGFYGHKGATRSWRYSRPHSPIVPQITKFVKDGEDMFDIDNDLWRGKTHILREVFVHFASKHSKIFGIRIFRIPEITSQPKVAKRLLDLKASLQN